MDYKQISIFIFIFVLLISLSVAANPKLTYYTTIEENSDQVHVKLKIEDLKRDKIIIGLPSLPQETSNHESFSYLNYLHNLKAYKKSKEFEIEQKNDLLFINVDSDLTYLEYAVDNQIYSMDSFRSEQARTWVYFTDDYGYYWSNYIYFVPELKNEPSSVHIHFDLPEGWKVFGPLKKEDDYFAVEYNDVISLSRQITDTSFYMGKVDYVAESTSNNTKHQIARLSGDENEHILTKYQEGKDYMDKVSKIYDYFVDYFDFNPYSNVLWRPEVKDFVDGVQYYPGFGYMGNGWHYWPEGREFEITCHVVQSWVSEFPSRPLMATSGIVKGFGEYYIGYKSAYELFDNEFDLAKLYYTYLVYDRAHDKIIRENHYEYEFIKGFALGIYLDNRIKEISHDNYSLKDVMQKVFDKYKLKNHRVTYKEVQEAIFRLTGEKMESEFNNYVYGDKKIPAYEYISEYKKYFEEMHKEFNEVFYANLNDYKIPYFINIEMTLQKDQHIMAGIFAEVYAEQFANYMISNYNINSITKNDVVVSLSELTGRDCSGFFSHWEDTYGIISIEALKDWLKYEKKA